MTLAKNWSSVAPSMTQVAQRHTQISIDQWQWRVVEKASRAAQIGGKRNRKPYLSVGLRLALSMLGSKQTVNVIASKNLEKT